MPLARRLARSIVAALAVTILWVTTAEAASLFDPLYRFRRLHTEHFAIYFHQGEDQLAARLAGVAERAWHKLERPLGTRPPPLTHVILADQTELANGYAFPLPRDTIVLNVVWPGGAQMIGRQDDWLTLAFTHELTHIVHLDRSEGWARIVRNVFGRIPLAFPNIFLPAWQIEGLATYEESAITGQGRMHAGDFAAVVSEAGRARRLEPLDRVNGGLIDWPGGLAPYAYGLGFHAYLAEHYGDATLAELAHETARRLPYLASRAFIRVYGRSLGDLWRDYREHVTAASAGPVRDTATQITHHGFNVAGPRFLRPACAGCPADVIYGVQTPHGFPVLNRLTLDGSAPRRLATRAFVSTVASGPETIFFSQLELRRNIGLYADLHALDRTSGHLRRLTWDARLLEPDLSPDGRTIVAVQDKPGRRDLVLVPLQMFAARPAQKRVGTMDPAVKDASAAAIVTLISDAETQFNAPRWSPDGRTIAVERHRLGAQAEIVTVDTETRAVRVIASDANTRWVTPAWRPDGRALIAAADLNDGPFNLHEIEIDRPAAPPRQLTSTSGGATWPDVSPDGASIVYVGLTATGSDLFRISYPAIAAAAPPTAATSDARSSVGERPGAVSDDFSRAGAGDGVEHRREAPDEAPFEQAATSDPRPYSPWPTLKPTWWSPIVSGDHTQLRVGAATAGSDVLGYHGFGASLSWLVSSRGGAPQVDRTTPDWRLFYVYDRWRPTIWATASRDTSFFGGPPTDAGVPTIGTLRERQVQAGIIFPIRHLRLAQTMAASVVRAADEFTFPDRLITRNRTAARAGWAIGSALTHGYSISPEGGVTLGITAEAVRRALGASADATALTGDARAYLPGLARHHVLAIRLAGAGSSGDRGLRRTFNLGGALPNLSTMDFGREAISLLRGFPADTFAGSHVALANLDYRWPLARPQRGAGTWPLFLQTIHAAVFADAGHAWTHAFRLQDVKTSAGGELSIDFVAAYFLPFTASVGAAWGHDGSHTVSDRTTVYVRIGRAF